jgi:hypothetical protein
VKRSGAPKRRTPLKQTRSRPNPVDKSLAWAMWEDLRLAVFRRDNWHCVAAPLVPQVKCHGKLCAHHLWRRGQGGPDVEWNLKSVCIAHHTWIHNEGAAEALALDLLRRRGQTEAVDKPA